VVLQWLASHAATGYAVNPRDTVLPTVIASAQVWLLASVSARAMTRLPTDTYKPLAAMV
jgi:hypothetical protein